MGNIDFLARARIFRANGDIYQVVRVWSEHEQIITMRLSQPVPDRASPYFGVYYGLRRVKEGALEGDKFLLNHELPEYTG